MPILGHIKKAHGNKGLSVTLRGNLETHGDKGLCAKLRGQNVVFILIRFISYFMYIYGKQT